MDTKKQELNRYIIDRANNRVIDTMAPAKIVKKAKTLPEVVEELSDIAAKWGGVTESIRRLDGKGRIMEMDVTIKFTAV